MHVCSFVRLSAPVPFLVAIHRTRQLSHTDVVGSRFRKSRRNSLAYAIKDAVFAAAPYATRNTIFVIDLLFSALSQPIPQPRAIRHLYTRLHHTSPICSNCFADFSCQFASPLLRLTVGKHNGVRRNCRVVTLTDSRRSIFSQKMQHCVMP